VFPRATNGTFASAAATLPCRSAASSHATTSTAPSTRAATASAWACSCRTWLRPTGNETNLLTYWRSSNPSRPRSTWSIRKQNCSPTRSACSSMNASTSSAPADLTDRSARLDRQRRVLGPFSHRTVVKRQVLETKLVQQKQIERRRDAAAAVANHALVLGYPLRGKQSLGVSKRDEIFIAAHERCRRHVHASRNPARPAVAAWFQTFVELGTQRVDDHGVCCFGGGQHVLLVDKKAGARRSREIARRIAARRTAFGRPPLALPAIEAAVEHRGAVEAQGFEHPPEARRPHHRADAVEHDARPGREPVASEGRLELRGRRHHEAKPCGLIGELALQVEEIGARNMRVLERFPPGNGDIGIVAARRRRFEIGRTIVDSQI